VNYYQIFNKATYAASKRFLLDFSLALLKEMREGGATVTVLCPAGMPTTPECIDGIEVQGLMGQLTTQNIGTVAAKTLDAALRGRALVIPGLLNQLLQTAGSLVPPTGLANVTMIQPIKKARGKGLIKEVSLVAKKNQPRPRTPRPPLQQGG